LIPTDNSKVGWALSYSEILASLNWPFPAYIDLKSELRKTVNGFQAQQGRLGKWREKRRLNRVFALAKTDFMSALFRDHSRKVFEYWKASPVFKSKLPLLAEIELAYQREQWAVCLPAALPLLDFMIRTYFGADKRDVSIATLCAAFRSAKVFPKDLKPGYAIWEGQKNPDRGNALASSEDEDLRIIGVLLSSFLEFAKIYYSRSRPDSAVLNRHAILHGFTEYWNCENNAKLLTFLDLTLRLQRPLEVVIHGANAPWLSSRQTPTVQDL
jgi:hypothetical protein